jgi:hypothetical protein
MVAETVERQVPVLVREQVPVTIQQTVARQVIRQVPVWPASQMLSIDPL